MKPLLLLCLLLNFTAVTAQELFIHTEPASNLPKGVLGVRLAANNYSELGTPRYWTGLSLMYGVSARLMVNVMASASNHHDSKLPKELFSEDGNGQSVHSHNATRGREYDMRFEGVNLYSKYRIFTLDGTKKHVRLAAYGQLAVATTAHDEAEPDLMGDNSGLGGGIVFTQLIKRFAHSTTIGYIHPFKYTEKSTSSEITSGNAWSYAFSMGYQIFPLKMKSYKQPGLNIYCEFLGKEYEQVTLKQNGEAVNVIGADALLSGSVLDVRPGFQLILNANTRFDVSMAWLVAGKSYARSYPELFLKIQHYFYTGK
ncbi:MAG: hypothetical protein IPP71_17445 [Bacteroidetes bacterium]|nr:hypothetical protein [Bacteroidota bacterium]